MTKQDALDAFGVARPIDLARAVGLTRQAINTWGDTLSDTQRDRVQAALYRELLRHIGLQPASGAAPLKAVVARTLKAA